MKANQEIIEKVLKNGIIIIDGNKKIPINAFVSISYLSQLNKFIIAYGTSSMDAKYVNIDDYGVTWIPKE